MAIENLKVSEVGVAHSVKFVENFRLSGGVDKKL